MKNWITTVLGMFAGALTYIQQAGAKLPENGNDWFALLVGTVLAALGAAARDSRVEPKAPEGM